MQKLHHFENSECFADEDLISANLDRKSVMKEGRTVFYSRLTLQNISDGMEYWMFKSIYCSGTFTIHTIDNRKNFPILKGNTGKLVRTIVAVDFVIFFVDVRIP